MVAAAAAALVASVVGLSALAVQQARSYDALAKEEQEGNPRTTEALPSRRVSEQAEAVGSFLVDALKKPEPGRRW